MRLAVMDLIEALCGQATGPGSLLNTRAGSCSPFDVVRHLSVVDGLPFPQVEFAQSSLLMQIPRRAPSTGCHR